MPTFEPKLGREADKWPFLFIKFLILAKRGSPRGAGSDEGSEIRRVRDTAWIGGRGEGGER